MPNRTAEVSEQKAMTNHSGLRIILMAVKQLGHLNWTNVRVAVKILNVLM